MTPPVINPGSMDKAEVIRRSLRCFTLGLIGILPVLGVPFAVVALSNYFQVKRNVGPHWNPAQAYLVWGLATASSGLVLTAVTVGVVGSMIYLDLA